MYGYVWRGTYTGLVLRNHTIRSTDHIDVKIQVSKRQTLDGMVYYKVEAVAIGEDANNNFVRPEYWVMMESRAVAIV